MRTVAAAALDKVELFPNSSLLIISKSQPWIRVTLLNFYKVACILEATRSVLYRLRCFLLPSPRSAPLSNSM